MHTVSLDSSCLQRDRRLIASVTKAAKIFCVRGCLRTGVQLCALSRRARVSEEVWFPPLRARRRPPLQARMSGELSAAAAPGPLATLCETPLRPRRRPALVRLERWYRSSKLGSFQSRHG